jgi:hypothetical protein
MTRPVDIQTIVAMLADRAAALCAEILPAGVREGNEWRVGSLAGEAGRSMAVSISGPRKGIWCDFSTDRDRGDALDLVAGVLFGGDKAKALGWARGWLGLEAFDPEKLDIHRREVEKAKVEATKQESNRRANAHRLFISALPLPNTLAEDYLRGRCIDFRQLGRWPNSLRFHPDLYNGESNKHWPALVAAINDYEGNLVAVHRTWLAVKRPGVVMKAPLQDPKMTLGRYAGGAIRLWRGESGKSFKDAPAGEWVVIGEGIEDTLTAVLAKPEMRALAAVSLGNMAAIQLPAACEGVVLLAQNDPPGSSATKAFSRAIEHFQAIGLRVKVARPPAEVKDINELLMREGL